ncbi:DinB family protein [Arsenicicoccus cauae]|uniref:DinB family protein n=1 Tax=Arsenicicoccus cauae TaxID=2663847 RepID=UPI002595691F|nr:DinB family protein [uncultured Arsenicicoccus sp.]
MASEAFRARDLSGSTFRDVSLRDAVMRGVDVDGLEIDAPWLLEEPGRLIVNGVDVAPLIDGELDRKFPGRALRRASSADGLRDAWAAVEQAWQSAVRRVEAMPSGSMDEQVGEEWSFAQTVRHLVMATDTWLRKAVLGVEQPYHPVGLPDTSFVEDGGGTAVFRVTHPDWAEVLQARGSRMRMVREFLETVTDDDLSATRPNPHAPEHQETVLSCVRTVLEEEWEHLRYATRDLDALDERALGGRTRLGSASRQRCS